MTERAEDLEKAYKKERDSKVKTRIHAVMLVLEDDMEVSDAAHTMRCSENSVRNWIEKFTEGGINGLRDLPRRGRTPAIPKKELDVIMDKASKRDTNPAVAPDHPGSDRGGV